jgi:hypothetical protein
MDPPKRNIDSPWITAMCESRGDGGSTFDIGEGSIADHWSVVKLSS